MMILNGLSSLWSSWVCNAGTWFGFNFHARPEGRAESNSERALLLLFRKMLQPRTSRQSSLSLSHLIDRLNNLTVRC